MITPIVKERSLRLEPVTHDTFAGRRTAPPPLRRTRTAERADDYMRTSGSRS
jgi:hypothetical protein